MVAAVSERYRVCVAGCDGARGAAGYDLLFGDEAKCRWDDPAESEPESADAGASAVRRVGICFGTLAPAAFAEVKAFTPRSQRRSPQRSRRKTNNKCKRRFPSGMTNRKGICVCAITASWLLRHLGYYGILKVLLVRLSSGRTWSGSTVTEVTGLPVRNVKLAMPFCSQASAGILMRSLVPSV